MRTIRFPHVMPTLLLVVLILTLAACAAPAAAPVAAPAEEAAAAAPAEEAPGGQELPPVNPAGQAAEATAQPDDQDAQPAQAATVDGFPAPSSHTYRILPARSQAQYAVEEEFFGQAIAFITAVGSTSDIEGEVTMTFEGNTVTLGDNSFTVDLSTLTSDRPRRDKAIREEWLESAKYPTATFVASGIAGLPADAAPGKPIAFDVEGDLTIRDITHPQRWAMTAQLDGDLLSGTATTYLLMRNFGFEPPDIGGILKVTDGVTVTVTFVAQEVQP